MNTKEALLQLEALSEKEFQTFLNSLPLRTQYFVRGGDDWREILPKWWIKKHQNSKKN